MAVPKRTRYEVLRRDNNTCTYCHATDSPLTVDHVVPVALGGSDDPSNLVAACVACNQGKASSNPDAELVAQVSEEALRWSKAVQAAASASIAHREAEMERLGFFFDYWMKLTPGYLRDNPSWLLANNWEQVVSGFLSAGLPDVMLTDAAHIALTSKGVNDRFRYFIGVARTMTSKLHEQAQALLREGNF